MGKIEFNLSEKQTLAWDTLERLDVNELMYGGAKYGGKSVFGCIWSYCQAKMIQKICKIGPRKFPIPVGFMGRKRGVDFVDTTLETWKRFIPPQNYEIRIQDKEIVLDGHGVKIVYGGFDDEMTVQKFNSAEYGFGFVDQTEEVSRDGISMLRGALADRLIINGVRVKAKLLLTANPAICWLKDEFISSPTVGKKFVQALPADNPYLTKEAIDRLRDAFRHRPELLEAYLHGNWDEIEGSDLVMTEKDVRACVNYHLPQNDIARLISCDVARFGDDETVRYLFEGYKVIGTEFYTHRSTMETAGKLWALKNKKNALMIASDVIGEGAGVVDRLKEMAGDSKVNPILAIDSREKPIEEPNSLIKFLNRRAQMWWRVAELFKEKKVSIPDDDVLIGQLSSVRYFFASNGRIKIESKEDIKKRLLRSPDRADALVYGLWAIKRELPAVKAANAKYRGRLRRREGVEEEGNPVTGY